jgi:hypothetical protein
MTTTTGTGLQVLQARASARHWPDTWNTTSGARTGMPGD